MQAAPPPACDTVCTGRSAFSAFPLVLSRAGAGLSVPVYQEGPEQGDVVRRAQESLFKMSVFKSLILIGL